MSITVAIFRTGGIGDVILSTVAITVIRKAVSDATILWFGRQPTLDLVKAAFPFVQVFEISSGASFSSNFSKIRNAADKIDLVLDLQKSLRTILLGRATSFYFKCPYFTWNKYSLRRSWMVAKAKIRGRKTSPTPSSLPLKRRFELMRETTIKGLQRLGYDTKFCQKEFPSIVSSPVKENATAICLGALYKSKELPLEKVKSFLSFISENESAEKIYILGDSRKEGWGNLLQNEFEKKGPEIENLCGKTSLWEAAKVLSKCNLAIANDTALAHLAESVSTPVLMFFGPTHENFGYRPFLPLSKSFSAGISCRPCTKGGKTSCFYKDFKCLNSIEMQPVFDHIQKLTFNLET